MAVVTPKNKEPKATNTQQILSIKMAIDVILRIVFDFSYKFYLNILNLLYNNIKRRCCK